jgi:Na+/citrate or Na+/malate symporter
MFRDWLRASSGMNDAQRLRVVALLVVLGLVLTNIFTQYGVAGMLLGVTAPLCLFAAAAFVYFGGRKRV